MSGFRSGTNSFICELDTEKGYAYVNWVIGNQLWQFIHYCICTGRLSAFVNDYPPGLFGCSSGLHKGVHPLSVLFI